MNLIRNLTQLLNGILPVETGVFSGKPPDRYIVITPLNDSFELHADDFPRAEVQEARVCLFVRGNYLSIKNRIVRAILQNALTITDRRYIGHDDSTGHHQHVIDVAKEYDFEEENYGNDWS